MPKRIQMSRQHRWRPDHPAAVIVARPSRWGNPLRWEPGPTTEFDEHGNGARGYTTPAEARQIVVDGFRRVLADPDLRDRYGIPSDEEIRRDLAGRDLACWCPLDQPCHADVLLALAAGGEA